MLLQMTTGYLYFMSRLKDCPHGKLQFWKNCPACLRFEHDTDLHCTQRIQNMLIIEMQTLRHYDQRIIAEPFDEEGNTLGHITAKSGNVNLFKVLTFQYRSLVIMYGYTASFVDSIL